ncbi:MAG: Na/Pi cotransporter family protein [Clostridia bacterium]|nr:MAG: Na/Pi cotransporter family protein [Clostridia bacterium]
MAGTTVFSLLLLVVSLLFFFLGLRLMQGLSQAAAPRLGRLLVLATSTPWRGLVVGTAVTALVHSSSAVTITTVALVTSGLLPLENALGIVLGSNIGTCATVQFLALDFTRFGFPLAALGLAAALVSRRIHRRRLALAVAGLGFLLAALDLLARALTPLAGLPSSYDLLAHWAASPGRALAAGMVATAVVQSSTLFTAAIVTFTAQGLLTLPAAVALVLGSNIGTCADTLVAAIWGNGAGRRVALAHLLLNLGGVAVFFPLTGAFAALVSLTSASPAGQVANAHLLFNLITSLAALPFTRAFAAWLGRLPGHG